MAGKRWSNTEKGFLEAHYFNTPKYEIARLLNRSYKSILDYGWVHRLSSYKKQYNIGIKQAREIDLSPTFELGVLCGLILGDGFLFETKTRNYRVSLETTKPDFAQYVAGVFEKACPALIVHRWSRIHTRKFPNGIIKTDSGYVVEVNSKILYEAIRPFKQKDFIWRIPTFLISYKSQIGFLRGIFDAEGSIGAYNTNKGDLRYHHISLSSKHRGNLIPIQDLLLSLGILSHLYTSKNISALEITRRIEATKFQKLINFGFLPKKERLEGLLWQPKQLVSALSAVIL